MLKSDKKTLLIAGGVCIGLCAWAFLVRPMQDDGWTEVSDAPEGGFERIDEGKARGLENRGVSSTIRRREVSDPTNFSVEWSLHGVSEEIRVAAKHADRLAANLSLEEPEWAQFYNALTDPFFMHDLLEICGPHYDASEDCYVSVTLVAQGNESETGRGSVVSYAAMSDTQPGSVECREYASCIGRGFIGRELPPLPGKPTDPQGTVVTWGLSAWDDERIQVNRERIETCIAESSELLVSLREEGLPEPSLQTLDYQIGKFENRLAYCEWLLEELG